VINFPIEAQYVVYYGIDLTHAVYTWAGTSYTKQLVTEYPSEELVSSVSTEDSTNARFLYPKLVGNPTYVDGVAEGHFTIANGHASEGIVVTNYTISLIKTNNVPNNETIIGTYQNSPSSMASISAGTYLTFPIAMNISKQKVDEDEKLILEIDLTITGSGQCDIQHYNGGNPDDIKIKIPYAPIG